MRVPAVGSDSFILPEANGRDLLYVTGYPSTDLYTYPNGRYVSALHTNGFAMCSDKAGHVFITNAYGVAEYPHGGASQIVFLNGPFGEVGSCSVDPTTGNLAVTSASTSGFGVGVYRPGPHHRWHRPRIYTFAQYPVSCSYDSTGDLFVDATLSDVTYLFELRKGSSTFQPLSLGQKIAIAGYIQWDGRFLAVADNQTLIIHRFAITGSTAKQIGTMHVSHANEIGQFWIQGHILVGLDALREFVGFWHYPKGGAPFEKINMTGPLGATVSLAHN